MNIYWLIWTSWLSLSLFLSWEDSTHVTSRCERCQRARYRLLAVAAHFSPGYLTVCCFCFSNWKNMAAMWFSANPGYNFYTIQLSHTFQVVLNILFTKQFGNVIPGWKNTKKKKHSSSGNPSDTTAYHRTWRQCAAMKGRQMDVLLDGRNPPKNADLGMVYSWVYHIILYVYIYMYIYIYCMVYSNLWWLGLPYYAYIYNYPQMVYVNGVSNPCWGR